MNIFVLDNDPNLAAKDLCDKHISKMAIETAQMLYTAHWSLGSKPSGPIGFVSYKQTHVNHPCSVWTRESKDNYDWLAIHGLSIVEQYHIRYKKVHACAVHLNWLANNHPKCIPLNKGLTPFAMAFYSKDKLMFNKVYVPNDAVQSYRNYYKTDKSSFAKWKYTNQPVWW